MKGCTRAKTETISMEMEGGAFVINERISWLWWIYIPVHFEEG
jgi:hypothetical protein